MSRGKFLTKADLRRCIIRTAALTHWKHNGGCIGIPANSNSARPHPQCADSQRGVSIELPHASLATVSEPVHAPQHAALHNSCQCEVLDRFNAAQVRQ